MQRRLKISAVLAIMAGLSACSGMGKDAVTRGIESGRGVNGSLMPQTFAPSFTGTEVIRRLEAAGYRPDRSRIVGKNRTPIPADGQHYRKSVTEFPCLNIFEVVVRTDPSDRIIDVYGTHWQAACT